MYEKDIEKLNHTFKGVMKRLQNKSYHTKNFKADVQYQHMLSAMKKFNEQTDFLGPQNDDLTENLSFVFQYITDGTTAFSVPYHTVKRYEIVNCKKGIDLINGGVYEQLDGLSEEEVENVKQLKQIIKGHHKFAVRTADASQSNNEPWGAFKPLDNETVMIIAKAMMLQIKANVNV